MEMGGGRCEEEHCEWFNSNFEERIVTKSSKRINYFYNCLKPRELF
jgi:hypothetical protein